LAEPRGRVAEFIDELHRRKTFRTIVVYGAAALGIVEGTDIILGVMANPPTWILPTLIIAFAVGFPFAVVGSWIFDITPPGLKRTDEERIEFRRRRDDSFAPAPTASSSPGTSPDTSPAAIEAIPADVASAAAAEGARGIVPEEDEGPPGQAAEKPALSVELGSAQRRQVTMLSCTFTPTSDDDPEAMFTILPEIEALVARVAQRFSANRITGTSVTHEMLFGFPTAHENDAASAVAAGLALIEGARALAYPSEGRISAAIGVYSDLAIVETSDEAELRVVGRSAQIAAWLQSLAPPDSVTFDDNTSRLLRERFRSEGLGEVTNSQLGFKTTLRRAHAVSSPSGLEDDRIELIGRDSEVALVMDRWDRAIDGEAQFVVLRGEAGMGKSRIAREIIRRAAESESAQIIRLFCSPFEGSSPFHPIIHFFLGPESQSEAAGTETVGLARMRGLLSATDLDISRAESLLATLLSFEHDAPAGQTSETARQEMVSALLEIFNAHARRSPLLLCVEDLHWADPSTLEILGMLVQQHNVSGMLCLFSTRPGPEFEWEARSNVTSLMVPRMSRRTTENLIERIVRERVDGDAAFMDAFVARIVTESDGNPLFAEELTKSVVESVDFESGAAPTDLVLPGTLHQSLASRIDRLGTAKPLLQLCSLLGREFDYGLLRAVSQTENEEALNEALQTIVQAEFLSQTGVIPDCTYTFKHILMQDTAYQSLLKSTRGTLHAQVAETLETQFPEKTEREPDLLAFHFQEAGDPARAAFYWSVACRRALGSFALLEAIELAHSGLRSVEMLPASTERDRAELALTSLLGKGLLTTRGYADPEVEPTFARALELCESLGDEPQLFQIVGGLWMYFEIGGEAEHALALAERLIRMAEADASPARTLQGHYCAGYTLYRLGRYAESREQLERAMSAEDSGVDFTSESASGDDTRIHIRCALAHVLWHLGYSQRAEDLAEKARALAVELGNPYGILWSTFQTAWLYELMERAEDAARYSAASLQIAEEKAFGFFQPISAYVQAWASGDGGQTLQGVEATNRIEAMVEAIHAHSAAGARLGLTQMLTSVAENLIRVGDLERAEQHLEAARAETEAVNERFFEPEVDRMAGLIASARGDDETGERLLSAALQSSRDSGSLALALRATNSLAELHRRRGNTEVADRLLAEMQNALPESP